MIPHTVLRHTAAMVLCAALAGCASVAPTPDAALGAGLNVATAALATHQVDAAQRLYAALADAYPRAPEPRLGLAGVARARGDTHAAERHAIDAAERARSKRARAAAFIEAAGDALARGDVHDAQRHSDDAFKAAQRARPPAEHEMALAHGVRARALAARGDTTGAEAALDEALALRPGEARLIRIRVQIRLEAGDQEGALKAVGDLRAGGGREEDARALEALIAQRTGQPPPTKEHSEASAPKLHNAASDTWTEAARAIGMRQKDVDTGPEPIRLVLGQSTRVELKAPATDVLVTEPDIARANLLSATTLFVSGRGAGTTTLAVRAEDASVTEHLITVTIETASAQRALRARTGLSKVRVRPIGRGVALTGAVQGPGDAERAMRIARAALPNDVTIENDLRIDEPLQVNLEVQIAEVQRSVTEHLGVEWEFLGNRTTTRIGKPGINTGGISWLYDSAANAPRNLEVIVDALAEAGLANVLARPNLTAVSGHAATFFAGEMVPRPIGVDEQGKVTYNDTRVGVLLEFVPTVIDNGRIVLNVKPEVSALSPTERVELAIGLFMPTIDVRRTETTVELGDGESVVIGGLYRTVSSYTERGIPLLKDVPGLGSLFGRTRSDARSVELLIIVTARLVQPQPAVERSQ